MCPAGFAINNGGCVDINACPYQTSSTSQGEFSFEFSNGVDTSNVCGWYTLNTFYTFYGYNT
jgi:hypothetical protein